MGLFDLRSSKNSKQNSIVEWIDLTSIDELNQLAKFSEKETVLIFKHSTRCGISRMVKKQFEKMFDESMKNYKAYYLDLLNHRDVSNQIEIDFKVKHQSPQLLIIKNGEVVLNASHYDITQVELSKYM